MSNAKIAELPMQSSELLFTCGRTAYIREKEWGELMIAFSWLKQYVKSKE